MDQRDSFDVTVGCGFLSPIEKLLLVGVAAASLKLAHLSFDFIFLTVDFDPIKRTIKQDSAQCVRGLVTSEQDDRVFFFDVVL